MQWVAAQGATGNERGSERQNASLCATDTWNVNSPRGEHQPKSKRCQLKPVRKIAGGLLERTCIVWQLRGQWGNERGTSTKTPQCVPWTLGA